MPTGNSSRDSVWRQYLDIRLSGLEERLDEQREMLAKHMDRKEASLDRLEGRIRTLESESANMRGRIWMLGTLLSTILLIINVLSQFLK
jgi:predicted nuclease with TOPRIM domain